MGMFRFQFFPLLEMGSPDTVTSWDQGSRSARRSGLKCVFESQCCDYLGYYDDGTKVEILPALGVKEDLKQPRGLQSPLSGFQQVIYYFALHCVQGGTAGNMYV